MMYSLKVFQYLTFKSNTNLQEGHKTQFSSFLLQNNEIKKKEKIYKKSNKQASWM